MQDSKIYPIVQKYSDVCLLLTKYIYIVYLILASWTSFSFRFTTARRCLSRTVICIGLAVKFVPIFKEFRHERSYWKVFRWKTWEILNRWNIQVAWKLEKACATKWHPYNSLNEANFPRDTILFFLLRFYITHCDTYLFWLRYKIHFIRPCVIISFFVVKYNRISTIQDQ